MGYRRDPTAGMWAAHVADIEKLKAAEIIKYASPAIHPEEKGILQVDETSHHFVDARLHRQMQITFEQLFWRHFRAMFFSQPDSPVPIDPPHWSTPFHVGCILVLVVFSLVGLVLGFLEALRLLNPNSSGSTMSAQCVPSSASSLSTRVHTWVLGIGTFFAHTSRLLPVGHGYIVVPAVVLLVGYSRADASIELQVPGGPVLSPLSTCLTPYRASSMASPDIDDFLVHESTAFLVLHGRLTPGNVVPRGLLASTGDPSKLYCKQCNDGGANRSISNDITYFTSNYS